MSNVEQRVLEGEKQLRLAGVRFDIFEGAIKRYGYVGRVRDESLREVHSDINLDLSKFNDTESYVSKTYKAKRAFDHGNYDVEHLLILGFLLTHHENDQ